MKVEHAHWGFWLQWVLASIVGWWALSLPVSAIAPVVGAMPVVSGSIVGAGVGIMQWLVLRRRFHRAGWWVLASTMGWAVGWAVGQNLIEPVTMFLAKYEEALGGRSVVTLSVLGVMVGGVAGIMQWFVLRRWVYRAGWWILANIVGWTTGFVAGPVVVAALWTSGVLATVMGGVILGAVPGAITGMTLVWLSRHSFPGAQEQGQPRKP